MSPSREAVISSENNNLKILVNSKGHYPELSIIKSAMFKSFSLMHYLTPQ